jgi:hypothetical protein
LGKGTDGEEESGSGVTVVGGRSRQEVIGRVHKQLTASVQKWKAGVEQ